MLFFKFLENYNYVIIAKRITVGKKAKANSDFHRYGHFDEVIRIIKIRIVDKPIRPLDEEELKKKKKEEDEREDSVERVIPATKLIRGKIKGADGKPGGWITLADVEFNEVYVVSLNFCFPFLINRYLFSNKI